MCTKEILMNNYFSMKYFSTQVFIDMHILITPNKNNAAVTTTRSGS
jgi:hypothetical protein